MSSHEAITLPQLRLQNAFLHGRFGILTLQLVCYFLYALVSVPLCEDVSSTLRHALLLFNSSRLTVS